MLVGIRYKKVVGTVHVIVEPRVDFYSTLCPAEFRPAKVIQIEAYCGCVDNFKILLFLPASPAAENFVMLEKVELKFLKHLAATAFIRMCKICPCDV